MKLTYIIIKASLVLNVVTMSVKFPTVYGTECPWRMGYLKISWNLIPQEQQWPY